MADDVAVHRDQQLPGLMFKAFAQASLCQLEDAVLGQSHLLKCLFILHL